MMDALNSLIFSPYENGKEHWRAFSREQQWNGRAITHLVAGFLEIFPFVGHIVYLFDKALSACLSSPQVVSRVVSKREILKRYLIKKGVPHSFVEQHYLFRKPRISLDEILELAAEFRSAGYDKIDDAQVLTILQSPERRNITYFGTRNQFDDVRGKSSCTVQTFDFIAAVFRGEPIDEQAIDPLLEDGATHYMKLSPELDAKRKRNAAILLDRVGVPEKYRDEFLHRDSITGDEISQWGQSKGLNDIYIKSLQSALIGKEASANDVENSTIFENYSLRPYKDGDDMGVAILGRDVERSAQRKFKKLLKSLQELSNAYNHAGASITLNRYSLAITVSKKQDGYIYRIFDSHGSYAMNDRSEAFIFETQNRIEAAQAFAIMGRSAYYEHRENRMDWRVYLPS